MVDHSQELCALHTSHSVDISELKADSKDHDRRITRVENDLQNHKVGAEKLEKRVKANELKNQEQDLAYTKLATAAESLDKAVGKLSKTVDRILWKIIGGTTIGFGGVGGIGAIIYYIVEKM